MPGLDGIRGVAVLAVLFFHGGFGWAVGGWLGVSLFFTLSGYLITSVTLTEFEATGRVSLTGFWERRIRRLLPAALVTLAGVSLLSRWLVFDNQLDTLRGDILAALLNIANWRFWDRGESYAEVFGAPSPVVHFWSLSIEEQFYFVFPVLALVALTTGGIRRLAITAGVLAGASLAATLLITTADRSYYGTDTRAFEILVGVLLALWHRSGRAGVPRSERLASFAAGPVWIVMAVAMSRVITAEPRTSTWFLPAFACLSVVVTLAATVDHSPVSRVLRTRALTGLGTISYGVYLYHWPIFGLITAQRSGLMGWPLFLLRFGVTIGVAVVSYRVVESGVRHRAVLANRRRLATAMVTSIVVTAGFAMAWVSTPAAAPLELTAIVAPTTTAAPAIPEQDTTSDDTNASTSEGTSPAASSSTTATPSTTLPTFTRPVRILTVGDSTSGSAGEGLKAWGEASGEAVVSMWSAPGCGVIDQGSLRHQPGPGHGVADYCRNWPDAWAARIEDFTPDVIVVFYGPFDTVDRDVDGDGEWESPGHPAHDAVYLQHFTAKLDVLAVDDTPIVWMAPPYVWADSPRGSGNRSLTSLPDRVDALTRLLEELTAADQRVTLAPYGRLVDGGDVDVDFDQRYDGVHFSEGVAAALARDGMLDLILDAAATQLAGP